MNDPGLHEPIESDAKDVENQKGEEQSGKEEDEQAFLEPSRWWFASTAFPLVAGTFGPMGSAFSICALAVPWRVFIPPGGAAEQNGIELTDPKWLIGINAAQLVIALISNLFLLLNMARRVRFSIAQPITIIGWYISSLVLIGLCACTSGPLIVYPKEQHAFTGAFYFAIFSAGLYFLVATLMLANVWGAYKGHYAKEFQLTTSQRTLMLQTISFLVYLLSGAEVYTRIEGWNFLDAVYWADYTLLTVGIGDFAPSTHLGRGLLFPFAIGGIIILGLVIGSIRSLVLERGKVKVGARMVEKERRRLLKRIQKKEKTAILEPVSEESVPFPRAVKKKIDDEPKHMTELQRRKQEFDLIRLIQAQAATKRRWTSLIISGGTWFFLWFAGGAIFQASEHNQSWTYFGSLYFAYTSLLTIGYGDFHPQSNSGKAFFVFWSLLAVPSLTILISNMGDTIVKGIRDLTLWVGNFTVLPGEQGKRVGLKENIRKFTKGRVFGEQVDNEEETPPGILGESGKRPGRNGSGTSTANSKIGENDPQSALGRRGTTQIRDGKQVPKSTAHHHLILIRAIATISKHLNASPPRKYTYEEWAWYLSLIGEDEGSAKTHRKAVVIPEPDEGGAIVGEITETEKGDGEGQEGKSRVEWSWVGNRSPLMGEREEAEWVLEGLIKTLEREFEKVTRAEVEGKGEREDRERREEEPRGKQSIESSGNDPGQK